MKYRNFKTTNRPLVANLPTWAMNKAWGDAGLYVTFNFVQRYEKRADGQPADWNMNGGDNLIDIYNSLDPRFKQTIAYHSSSWNDEIPLSTSSTEVLRSLLWTVQLICFISGFHVVYM